MLKKQLPIIFIGLCVVIAVLVLGWSVFVKTEVVMPVKPPVVMDDNNQNSESDEVIDDFPVVEDDVVDDNVSEIDISDWKTYRNEEFGYEIKYPEDWNISVGKHEPRWHETVLGRVVISGGIEDPFYAPLSITIRSNGEKLSIEEWYRKNYPKGDSSRLQEVKFDKTNGMRVLSLWDNGLDGFYFSDEDKIYSVSIVDLQENAENQIMMNEKLLSTFKFIELADDISDWKTYRNEEFGYEIKYPEIYLVEDKSEIFIGDDPSMNPWYTRTDFLLSFVMFENPTSKCRIGFVLEVFNTTDKDKIKSAGGWEFIKESGVKKIENNLDVYLYSIDSGTNNMQVIFRDGRAYSFFYYHILEEDFNQILSTFKFIK